MNATKKRPRRMDGYVRVSRRMGREGPGYISPDVQRESIQRWADYRGVTIAAWHFDEDESGGTQNRPGLREAMRRVEDGETDGIACWRLNRFARNVAGAIDDVERVQAAGGVLAFVEEDIDPTGPFGSFILTILLAVATLERENLVQGWKTAKSRAMDRGVKIGPTPFGYRRRDDAVLEPDPKLAPIVAEAFRRAGEQGLHAAVDFLAANPGAHDEGARAGRERSWTTSTVRRLLANRAYLGENRYADRVDRDAHPALVTRAVWEAAQHEGPKQRRPARHYPLSGLARCASCGESMIGGSAGKGVRTYRCRASLKSWKGDVCPSPVNVLADSLEAHVRALLGDLLRETWEAHEDVESGLAGAELALREAEVELDSLVMDSELRRSLGAERFRRLADTTAEAVERAQAQYREAAARAARAMTVSEPELVESATPEELGVLARGGLEAVVVKRGRGNLDARVQLVAKGAPANGGVPSAKDAEDGSVKA
jgi:site-specific DNA recombinase